MRKKVLTIVLSVFLAIIIPFEIINSDYTRTTAHAVVGVDDALYVYLAIAAILAVGGTAAYVGANYDTDGNLALDIDDWIDGLTETGEEQLNNWIAENPEALDPDNVTWENVEGDFFSEYDNLGPEDDEDPEDDSPWTRFKKWIKNNAGRGVALGTASGMMFNQIAQFFVNDVEDYENGEWQAPETGNYVGTPEMVDGKYQYSGFGVYYEPGLNTHYVKVIAQPTDYLVAGYYCEQPWGSIGYAFARQYGDDITDAYFPRYLATSADGSYERNGSTVMFVTSATNSAAHTVISPDYNFPIFQTKAECRAYLLNDAYDDSAAINWGDTHKTSYSPANLGVSDTLREKLDIRKQRKAAGEEIPENVPIEVPEKIYIPTPGEVKKDLEEIKKAEKQAGTEHPEIDPRTDPVVRKKVGDLIKRYIGPPVIDPDPPNPEPEPDPDPPDPGPIPSTEVAEDFATNLVDWALDYMSPAEGLFSKFPFCVPYDFYLLFNALGGETPGNSARLKAKALSADSGGGGSGAYGSGNPFDVSSVTVYSDVTSLSEQYEENVGDFSLSWELTVDFPLIGSVPLSIDLHQFNWLFLIVRNVSGALWLFGLFRWIMKHDEY